MRAELGQTSCHCGAVCAATRVLKIGSNVGILKPRENLVIYHTVHGPSRQMRSWSADSRFFASCSKVRPGLVAAGRLERKMSTEYSLEPLECLSVVLIQSPLAAGGRRPMIPS